VALSEDNFEELEDETRIMPFNDVVTDPNGSSVGVGILISIGGRYEISVTAACVKGTIVFLKVFHDSVETKSIRLYEAAWSATTNSIVLDLQPEDKLMVAISKHGNVVDGKYNYFTVSLAEPF
jgi:hypothetical protein